MATMRKNTTGESAARVEATNDTARPASGSGSGATLAIFGATLAIFGALVSVAGIFFAAMGVAVGVDISMEAFGIVMGVVGYVLGARRLGVITIVLSTVVLIVMVMIGMGELPGLGPTDPLAF